MRKRMLTLAVTLAATLTIFGAGTASAHQKMATLNVVHGIPGLAVDVCVNGSTAIPDFMPGDVVSGIELPAGTYHLAVVAAGAKCSPAILKANAALSGGRNYTVVANLNASGTPNLKVFTSNVSKVSRGDVRLQVRHTAEAPAVNIWANGSPLNRGNRFTWGHKRVWTVPEGNYRVKVTLPGSSKAVIGPTTLKTEAGHAYQVYAWGNAGSGFNLAVVPVWVGQRG